MRGTKDLDKIVALALCSPYVEGNKPLSLMIISDRPESGKTEIVKRFSKTPGVEFATDISGYGLIRDFASKILDGKINHIVIPEFLKPLMKGRSAANNFTTTLQVVMEDGIMGVHTGFLANRMATDKVRAVGIIACMPKRAYSSELKKQWIMTGFLSRWLVVTYKYDDRTVDEIVQSIIKGEYIHSDEKSLDFNEKVKIEFPEVIGNKCYELSREITAEARKAGSAYGFRELKHIMSLVSSNVIHERVTEGSTRTAVTMEDYNEVERLGYLFNEQYNELKVDIPEVSIDKEKNYSQNRQLIKQNDGEAINE